MNYQANNNIKYFGNYQLIKDNKRIITMIIAGLSRIDAEIDEREHLVHKYLNYFELIYINIWNAFPIVSVTTITIKCSNRFNQYTVRDKIINYGLVVEECPWYSQKEI